MLNLLRDGMNGLVKPTGLSKKLTLAGETKAYPVYQVRLDALYYNDQNDRIATWISQYNSEHGADMLGALERDQFNDIIEYFIVQSNPTAIERTQMNIELVGQREPGVVLSDGRVIDGNRRFTCLRRLHQKDESFAYFETVILDISLENNRKQIKMLELAIQHGEEKKVDYNPLDRLVGVYQDIVESKMLTIQEYAESTNETVAEVSKRVEQAKLLVEFLEFINMPKQYHVARDYQAVSILADLQDMLRRNPDKEKADQIKKAVFTNIMMKTVGDGRKYIRNLTAMDKNGFLPAYLKEQERIGKEIQTRVVQFAPDSKAAIDHFVAQNEDLTDDLELSMDKSLLKAKRKETRSKPAQIVTKSLSMLRDVDTRVIEKLSDAERDKLRQQVDKLSQMVGKFDVLFDEDAAESITARSAEMETLANIRFNIAPRHLDDPDVVCMNINRAITGLTFTLVFSVRKTDYCTNNEVDFAVVMLDDEHQRLADEIVLHGKIDDKIEHSITLAARASGLSKCYVGIRSIEDKRNELQQLIPLTISMMFASDVDF